MSRTMGSRAPLVINGISLRLLVSLACKRASSNQVVLLAWPI